MRLFILLILLDLDGDCEQGSNLCEGVEEEIMEIEGDMSVTELCTGILLCSFQWTVIKKTQKEATLATICASDTKNKNMKTYVLTEISKQH